jgi:thioredoxin-dependent peroxiredoxin
MNLQLGDTAPDFVADTTEGVINFHQWLGSSWGILFSHPKDFTPVCTTELGRVAKLKKEFDSREIKVLALSVDGVTSHKTWIKDINNTQNTTVNFPIISDEERKISNLYGMIHPNASNNLTVRSVFIIDSHKKIRLTITYPASTGRSFDEILRVIDSLQLTDQHHLATPSDWQQGQDCIIVPSLSTEEAKNLFPTGFDTITPYLRTTAQPKSTIRISISNAPTSNTPYNTNSSKSSTKAQKNPELTS